MRISDWSSDVCSSDLLQVEDDEQDCDQVEAHVELAARVVEGLEAAFVGGDFLGVRTLAGNDVGGGDNDHRKPDCDADEDENRQIPGQHGVHAITLLTRLGGVLFSPAKETGKES